MRPLRRQHARFCGHFAALLTAALLVVLAFAAVPASAAPAMSQLRLGGSGGAENYMYTAGDTIYATGTAAVGRYYRFGVIVPGGSFQATSACAPVPVGGSVNNTYAIQPSDPVST